MDRYFKTVAFALCFFMASCTQEKRYHTDTGLIYQVFPDKPNRKDSVIKMGKTVKIRLIQQVRDSIMDNNYERMPLYWQVMPGFGNRYNPLETFDYGLHENDSVVTIQRVDSMLRKGIFKTKPKWMKGSDEWITRFKIVKVFSNDSLLQADKLAETKKVTNILKALSRKNIEAYLKSKQIKAVADTNGIYSALVKKGTGTSLEQGKQLDIHLTVTTLAGKKISSTKDKDKKPVSFVPGNGFFPVAIENNLKGLTEGSKLQLYIPGVLLFGVEPQSKEVKVEDNIIFDIEIFICYLQSLRSDATCSGR